MCWIIIITGIVRKLQSLEKIVITIFNETTETGHLCFLYNKSFHNRTITEPISILHFAFYSICTFFTIILWKAKCRRISCTINNPNRSNSRSGSKFKIRIIGWLIYSHFKIVSIIWSLRDISICTRKIFGRTCSHCKTCNQHPCHIFKNIFHIVYSLIKLWETIYNRSGPRPDRNPTHPAR